MNKTEFLVDRLKAARGWTLGLLEDIEESTWFDMPGPGIGHVAWQVGHLASSQVALIHIRCFDKSYEAILPSAFRETFGKGSTPVADRAAYPTVEEIRTAFDRIQTEAIELITGMTETELALPAGSEPHPLFATKRGAIATAAMHETFHAGQIALIRRLSGKPPLR